MNAHHAHIEAAPIPAKETAAKAQMRAFLRNKCEMLIRIAEDRELPPSAVCVANVLLLKYLNNKRNDAYPGNERLAAEIGIDEKTVSRALRALVKRGYLLVELGGGREKANVYRLKLPQGREALDPETPSGRSQNPPKTISKTPPWRSQKGDRGGGPTLESNP